MTDATKAGEQVRNGVDAVASPPTSPQTVRRRLMLGAAAVLPSVYTLTSGARQAVTSSSSCLEPPDRDRPHDFGKGKGHTADAPLFTLQRDGWLRKEVYYGVSNGKEAYCAMSDQAACMDRMTSGKAAAGSVWIALDGYRIIVSPTAQVAKISPRASAYGLVFVDQEGTIATLDPDGREDLYPVKESCWSSIMGGRGSMLG